jgi:polar amino acid transport system substrate-binding protein
MRPNLCSVIALSLVITSTCALAQTNIPAYNTYLTAPFSAEDENTGLAADLVGYLNGKLKGKYVITLQNLPRERLNQVILTNPDFVGIVLFANPIFFGDVEKKKYFWTAAIMADKNDVISPLSKKIEYNNPESFKDKRFVGVKGYKYLGLEERFGIDIKRIDVYTELAMLKAIASGRADVTVAAASVYNYLMLTDGEKEGLTGKLYVSTTPHLKFDRFMFVSNSNSALSKELSVVAEGMGSDPEWKAILKKYCSEN